AIPFDLLDPAYAAITGYHIDGTPFEGTRNTKRYMRRNPHALLHGLLTSDQGYVWVMPPTLREKNGYDYRCYKGLQEDGHALKIMSSLTKTEQWWSLSSRALDRIVFDRLCELAEHDNHMAERVRSVFESLRGQGIDEGNLLKQQ